MSIFNRESEFNSPALNKLIRDQKAGNIGTVHRTYNPDCRACVEQRQHTDAEWEQHHPDSRHGFSPEVGWTKTGLEPRPGGRVQPDRKGTVKT